MVFCDSIIPVVHFTPGIYHPLLVSLGVGKSMHAWWGYVTGFAKTCIVHTSTFSTLKIYKICYDYQTGMKLAGILELLSFYQSSKFQILMFFLSFFMNL